MSDPLDNYRAEVDAAWVPAGDVVTLRVGDQVLHHCGCGYETELVEVMAIHVGRHHGRQFANAGELVPFSLRDVVNVCGPGHLEDADDVDGPWHVVPNGRCGTRRYIRFVWEER